ncbi:MAG: YHS domain-containing protein [Melioribacteraceae bacterium]|nr:YHS domain-containing protein [Melioribacteraceae bacterium]
MLVSTLTLQAQHQMNHSQNDTTKKMHHMMDDSTKMHNTEMDSSQMKQMKMQHKMHKDKQPMEAMDSKEIWNSHCPIREGEVDSDTPTVQYKGKTIGFCCPECNSKFMENPEKYMKKFDENGNLKKKSE